MKNLRFVSSFPRAAGKQGLIMGIVAVVIITVIAVVIISQNSNDVVATNSPEPTPVVSMNNAESPLKTEAPEAEVASDAVESPETELVQATPEPTPTPPPVTEKQIEETWTGVVLDELTNEPIEGASVIYGYSDEVRWFLSGSEFNAKIEVATDAEGKFSIDLEKSQIPEVFFSPSYFIVHKDGYERKALSLMRRNIENTKMIEQKGLTIELGPGKTISGRVVDNNGNAVSKATVGNMAFGDMGMIMNNPNPTELPESPSAITTTDNSGNFTLTGIPEDFKHVIPARADGYVSANTKEAAEAGDTGVVIELIKGGATLTVTVQEADGTPVADATVIAYRQNVQSSLDTSDMMITMKSEQTDTNGIALLKDMAEGSYQIQSIDDIKNAMIGTRNASDRIDLGLNDQKEITLTFPNAMILMGIAKADGEPLAGVKISTMPYPDSDYGRMIGKNEELEKNRVEVISAKDGTFELKVNPLGGGDFANIFYQPPTNYFNVTDNGGNGSLFIQNLSSYQNARYELLFEKGLEYRGIVIATDKVTPVPDADVGVFNADMRSVSNTTSSDDGTFTATVPKNQVAGIFVKSDQGWATDKTELNQSDSSSAQKFVLKRYNAISGRILNSDMTPYVGANMMVQNDYQNPADVKFQFHIMKVSDDEGLFYFDQIPGGNFNVSMQTYNVKGVVAPDQVPVTTTEGEVIELEDIILDSGEMFEGFVLDKKTAEPIEGVNISYYVPTNNNYYGNQRIKTDETGYFKIEGLKEDSIFQQITFTHSDYDSEYKQGIGFEESPLTVELEPKKDIEIQVVDSASKRPVTHYRYAIGQNAWSSRVNGGTAQEVNDPTGKTTLEKQPNSAIRISVAELDSSGNPTGRKGAKRFTVSELTAGEVQVIELKQSYTISGKVMISNSEEPVADAVVQIAENNQVSDMGNPINPIPVFDSEDPFVINAVRTDRAGKFTMKGFAEGTYGLAATKEGLGTVANANFEITADSVPEDVVILMGEFGEINGTVTAKDGKPATGVQISYYAQYAWQDTKVTTDSEGKYKITDLKPGEYQLSANYRDPESNNYINDNRSVKVESGAVMTEDFDFQGYLILSGIMTRDGSPFTNGNNGWVSLQSLNGNSTPGGIQTKVAGAYEALVKPGDYAFRLSGNGQRFGGGNFSSVTVKESPKEQVHDVAFNMTEGIISVEMVNGEEVPEGNLQIMQLFQEDEIYVDSTQFNRTSLTPMLVSSGNYKVTYRSYNGLFSGESEFVIAEKGQDNLYIVLVDYADDERARVARVQQMLTDLGIDCGPVDGLMGPMTENGIRTFQDNYDLPVTGTIDDGTYDRLIEVTSP